MTKCGDVCCISFVVVLAMSDLSYGHALSVALFVVMTIASHKRLCPTMIMPG